MTPRFCFITCSYNARPFIHLNLDSIRVQNYPHYRVIYIDDASDDGSAGILRDYKTRYPDMPLSICRNPQRMWPAGSRYRGYQLCEDDEICVLLDGDDWLTGNDSLRRVAAVYRKHPQTLATFGSTRGERWVFRAGRALNYRYPLWRSRFRRADKRIWFPHLRTVAARILKSVPVSYLQDANGSWLTMFTDYALLLSVVELIGDHKRYRFIRHELAVYNRHNYYTNPLEGFDLSADSPERRRIHYHVRHRLPPLSPL